MRRIAMGLGVAAAIAAVQCEGTNTGNPPIVSFTGSDCQIDQGQSPAGTSSAALGSAQGAPPIGTSQQALSAEGGAVMSLDTNRDDFLWMHCIAWNLRDDSTLEVNYWNIGGGCSAKFIAGHAKFEDSKLHLSAVEKGCEVAGCGLCIYDFRFEVRDAPEGDIPVELSYDDENGKTCSDSVYADTFTLPTSTERSGTRCDPISSVGFEFPHCVRHGACGDKVTTFAGQTTSCPTCPNGDVCAPIAEGGPTQCLKPCTTDADCENPAMGCRDGGCVIVSRWRSP